MSESILIFLVSQAIAVLFGMIGIYSKVSLKLKELEVRIQAVEKQDDAIANKLDVIMEKISDILIKMEKKQDRHI